MHPLYLVIKNVLDYHNCFLVLLIAQQYSSAFVTFHEFAVKIV